MFFIINILVFIYLNVQINSANIDDETFHYTNEFAVEINGDRDTAEEVASNHGMKLLRHLRNLGSVYHFVNENISKKSKREADDLSSKLSLDPYVVWVEQQKQLTRSKRSNSRPDYLNNDKSDSDDFKSTVYPDFNDQFFKLQWYLVNRGQTGGVKGYDLNVAPAWKKGLTGRGIVVSILDDGVDHEHPDLKDNYDPLASADLNDPNDPMNDPKPTDDPYNSHGTKCAGAVAAKANNSNCCVGVAFNAKIGGVRLLDGTVTDLLEAQALLHNNQHVDIYSASWGPLDDGLTLEGPHRYCKRALEEGAKMGRGGKGSIFVWATGNGGSPDDCSCDGYVSSIYTLSIGSVSDDGLSTYFSEVCPSTMAVVFTGGSHVPPEDEGSRYRGAKVVSTDLQGKCTLNFQGTSSAAPLAAGCIALMLEANSSLTWRDVQHIVVETSVAPNEEEGGWVANGGGYHVNHRFGFGVLDCSRMVEAAESWILVQEQRKCIVEGGSKPRALISGQSLQEVLYTDGCSSSSSSSSSSIDRLEHVLLHIKINHVKRGDISISLTSPFGTRSELLKVRPKDTSSKGIIFAFMTVHSWGESPVGNWTLIIKDNSERGDEKPVGKLVSWSLIFYGVQGEMVNHERWKESDGYLLDNGKAQGTRLESRRRALEETLPPRSPLPASSSNPVSENNVHGDISDDNDKTNKDLSDYEKIKSIVQIIRDNEKGFYDGGDDDHDAYNEKLTNLINWFKSQTGSKSSKKSKIPADDLNSRHSRKMYSD